MFSNKFSTGHSKLRNPFSRGIYPHQFRWALPNQLRTLSGEEGWIPSFFSWHAHVLLMMSELLILGPSNPSRTYTLESPGTQAFELGLVLCFHCSLAPPAGKGVMQDSSASTVLWSNLHHRFFYIHISTYVCVYKCACVQSLFFFSIVQGSEQEEFHHS